MSPHQPGRAVTDRVIRAAIALFSRQGFYKTGTRDIARLADLSEVTVFRYFEHKEDIFTAALEVSYQSVECRLKMFMRSSEGRTPEEVVPKIISLLVDITTISPEFLKLVGVAVLEVRGKYQDMCCRLLAPLLTSITSYLTLTIKSGQLRNLNPAIVTAAMALTVVVQPELSRLIESCDLSHMNGREIVEEFSSFWLKVLVPADSQNSLNSVTATEAII